MISDVFSLITLDYVILVKSSGDQVGHVRIVENMNFQCRRFDGL